MSNFISNESILEVKRKIGDDPFAFKNDFLKFIRDEASDLLLWSANYSKIKFGSDYISNNWFSFALAVIFALFDFEIHMYHKLPEQLISKKIIEDAVKYFKGWEDVKNYYQDLRKQEPFLFQFSEELREVAKKLQNENRDHVKHEDVFMVGICYVYKIFEVLYSVPPRILLENGLFLFENDPSFREMILPIVEIPINKLLWQLNMPVWEKDGTDYWNLTPMEAINSIGGNEHVKRIIDANLSYPIITTEYKGKLVIIDGMHRLAKANIHSALSDYKENNTIKAKIIPEKLLKQKYKI